ncbi:MAG: hypothetical protein V1887_00145 [Candidatus Aenigmatarchaeota archaeon]
MSKAKPAEKKVSEPIVRKKGEERIEPIHPTVIMRRKCNEIGHDVFTYIWIAFIVALILTMMFFRGYVKQMINMSVLFLIFWYLEPLVFGMTGTTMTTLLSRGRKVAEWKRFPLFFVVTILVYVIYSGVEMVLDLAFPEEHINPVFVIMWLGMLFLLWVYKFSKGK